MELGEFFKNRSHGRLIILIVFYICFVCCVMAMFFLMGFIAIHIIIYSDSPRLRMESSLTGSTPGMGYRPALNLREPLISYKWKPEEQSFSEYVGSIWNFLYYYYVADEANYQRSDDMNYKASTKPYFFNVSTLGPCAQISYGYPEMQPCVYIKLNKLYGWKPKFFVSGDAFPRTMPESLRDKIQAAPKDKPAIWVSCEGKHPHDTKNMGTVEYYPGPSFDGKYFPYVGQPNYLSPLIALKFLNLTQNRLVTVKCRAWARNIKFGDDRVGTTIISFDLGSKEFQ